MFKIEILMLFINVFGFTFFSAMDDNNTNEVDFTVFLQQYKDKLPDGFQLRPLEPGDYDKNYIHVLSQLTSTGQVSREQFVDRFNAMTASNLYYVAVIEDLNQSFIVASITLVRKLLTYMHHMIV